MAHAPCAYLLPLWCSAALCGWPNQGQGTNCGRKCPLLSQTGPQYPQYGQILHFHLGTTAPVACTLRTYLLPLWCSAVLCGWPNQGQGTGCGRKCPVLSQTGPTTHHNHPVLKNPRILHIRFRILFANLCHNHGQRAPCCKGALWCKLVQCASPHHATTLQHASAHIP